MKIAVLTDTFLPQINGVTKTLSKMKIFMDSNGVDYRFFAPHIDGYNDERVVTLVSVPLIIYPECRITIAGYIKLRRELDDFNPDIIHLVTPFTIGLMGLFYGKENNIPIVSSYHTDFPRYLKYYNMGFLESTVWSYFNWFHNQCQINFCPSLTTKFDLEKHGVADVEIWGRGIDTNIYSPSYRSEEFRGRITGNDEIVLLYVGRISHEKELDVLLDTCIMLNNSMVNYRLVIVGDGPLKGEYEKLSIDNIHFVGYKSGEELSKYYANSDIFVFPSSSETYGNVVLEAMASGLAVVAPLSGGIVENLINDYNGISFKKGNSKDLMDKIIYLIENSDLRKSMGNRARQYTLIKGWNNIFKGLFGRYEDILNKNKVNKISA